MELPTIAAFLAIATIIFIGFFGNLFFSRFKIPDILFLIALGMILGPDILGTYLGVMSVTTLDLLNQFSDVFLSAALVIILFDGGLGLSLRAVTASMRLSTIMSVSAFLLSMFSVGLILNLIMNVDFMVALCLGAIVGGTSSAIVIPIVAKMTIEPKTKAMLCMESVITDVFVVVGALAILSIISIGQIDAVLILKDLASKFVLGGLVGFVAGIAWLFVLRGLQNQPFSYMITVAALFAVSAFVELPPVSSSGAVAALAFGLSIGNKEIISKRLKLKMTYQSDIQIQQFQSEITFFVRSFFFVYLGMLFRFGTFTEIHLFAGLLIISVIVLARWIVALMMHKLGALKFSDSMTIFAMMPRGLAAAVLATVPAVVLAGSSFWNESLTTLFLNTTLLVILGTTILTTIFAFATERNARRQKARKRLDEIVKIAHPCDQDI
jgi:cell volume regulation protein A